MHILLHGKRFIFLSHPFYYYPLRIVWSHVNHPIAVLHLCHCMYIYCTLLSVWLSRQRLTYIHVHIQHISSQRAPECATSTTLSHSNRAVLVNLLVGIYMYMYMKNSELRYDTFTHWNKRMNRRKRCTVEPLIRVAPIIINRQSIGSRHMHAHPYSGSTTVPCTQHSLRVRTSPIGVYVYSSKPAETPHHKPSCFSRCK